MRFFLFIGLRCVMAYELVGDGYPSCSPSCKIDYSPGGYTTVDACTDWCIADPLCYFVYFK